ncbi:ATP-dependent Clp protease adaptor ClpS [Rubrobacter taiwanensis]|uniref:ATP-dependent Clp protease adapter protein ClpS n=1 Tax=Rubrobacter taiwanensis TaxID=185139 RepID=A0A4R1BQZ6_9ACTN|nr:ATP-dependent Clp protease adaptor ClpS [Rubrobacter taiwanensis]TCJ19726.1 ATP-dependent Clp protease adaptor ClpS [Rubrobacter taiwanensis]
MKERTRTVPRKKTSRKVTQEPPYKVILHNDDYNTMEHVVETLRKVIAGMTLKRATEVMWEAHTRGQAVAAKCHKELAELYRERLGEEGLTATIEPD